MLLPLPFGYPSASPATSRSWRESEQPSPLQKTDRRPQPSGESVAQIVEVEIFYPCILHSPLEADHHLMPVPAHPHRIEDQYAAENLALEISFISSPTLIASKLATACAISWRRGASVERALSRSNFSTTFS